MTDQPLSNKRIIDCLNTHYGIQVTELTFLPIGADMNASVYKAETQDQSSYFIKLKHGHHQDISATIISLLQNAGIQHIIPPIKNKQGQPIQHIEGFTFIASPFVEGQDGFSRDLTDAQWITFGKVMKQIHKIVVPPSVQQMIRRENYSPKWREAVRSLYNRIESEPSTDEISAKLISFMKANTTNILLLEIINRLELNPINIFLLNLNLKALSKSHLKQMRI